MKQMAHHLRLSLVNGIKELKGLRHCTENIANTYRTNSPGNPIQKLSPYLCDLYAGCILVDLVKTMPAC